MRYHYWLWQLAKVVSIVIMLQLRFPIGILVGVPLFIYLERKTPLFFRDLDFARKMATLDPKLAAQPNMIAEIAWAEQRRANYRKLIAVLGIVMTLVSFVALARASDMLQLVISVFGTLFFGFGSYFLFNAERQKKSTDKLRGTGQRLD